MSSFRSRLLQRAALAAPGRAASVLAVLMFTPAMLVMLTPALPAMAAAPAPPPTAPPLLAAPTPPPTPTPPAAKPGPTPRASADNKRMVAATFTNFVVYDNGAGYLHGFWRTLGTAGPDTPARLQWGRGCPDISERIFLALHTAFANPDRFFLIVDKSPDPRQPGAHCLTHVELERINPPQEPPRQAPPPAQPPAAPPAPPAPAPKP